MRPTGGPLLDPDCGSRAATPCSTSVLEPSPALLGVPGRVTVEPETGGGVVVTAAPPRTSVTTVDCGAVGAGLPVAGGRPPVCRTVTGGRVGGGAAVIGGAGTQVAVAVALPRGAGSTGLPAPAGCQRQPSTTSAWTRDAAGPTFWYDHAPARPWKYAQYA